MGESEGELITVDTALPALLSTLQESILGRGNAQGFNLLMLEVLCDTGRLVVGAGTEEGWREGRTDGCSVCVPELQDYWYDQAEAGLPDSEFSAAIRRRVKAVGLAFKALIDRSLSVVRDNAGQSGFRYVVFGSSTEVIAEAMYP